jgi:hypothetical protein
VTTPQPTPQFTPAAGPALEADSAAQLGAAVAARLAPVCVGMAPEHFEQLVADVTAFTLRWSRRERGGTPPVFRAD